MSDTPPDWYYYDPANPLQVSQAELIIGAQVAAGYTVVQRQPMAAVRCTRPLAPPRKRYPLGKGYLLWQTAHCAGGDPNRASDRALEADLQWVALKAHDGPVNFNGDLGPWVKAFRDSGLDVWFWGYDYGNDPVAEAQVAAARCAAFGVRGYLVDAEGEYKTRYAEAARWMGTFKDITPDVCLGLCSFRYPALHATFPWAEFASGCDFHAPQVYWVLATTDAAPTSQLTKSLTQLRAVRDLPVVPIGYAAPWSYKLADGSDAVWKPSKQQLDNFHQAALAADTPGVGWYEWSAAENDIAMWETLRPQVWSRG